MVSEYKTWEDIGDETLALFGIDDDKANWEWYQTFAPEQPGLVKTENFESWSQFIRRKRGGPWYCRTEEWAYKNDAGEWVLVNRSLSLLR